MVFHLAYYVMLYYYLNVCGKFYRREVCVGVCYLQCWMRNLETDTFICLNNVLRQSRLALINATFIYMQSLQNN